MLPPLTVEGISESVRFWLSDLPEAYEGGQVGSGGRVGLLGNKDIFDTPFSISSYTAELIENQQARTVADVIRNDASAFLNHAGQGSFQSITIRGFFINADLAALYDGLPNLTSYRSTVQTLDRVEVFKGPNALLNGASGRVGGVINLVPKRPTDTPLTRFTADYDYQSRLGIHADLSRRFGSKKQFGARLNAIYRNGEGPTEGNKETFGEVALALEYRGDRLKLETILDYQDRELRRGDQFFFLSGNATAVPSAPNLENALQQPWEKQKIKAARGLLRAEYAFGRDWAAYAAYGALGYEEYYVVRTIGRNLGARGDFNPFFSFFPQKQNSSAWNAGIRGRFETFGVTHQLSMETMRTKAEGRWSKNDRLSNLNITSNLYKPVFFARPAFDSTPAWGKSYEVLESSIALADTLGFLDERLLLTAGVRRQSIGLKRFNWRTGALNSQYEKSAITPAFGLLVKPWDFVSLYGNYIEALERGPTAPRGTVNEGEIFPPSVTNQIELGMKLDLDGLGLTAGLFQIERPSAFTDANNRFGLNGEQRNRGFELTAFGEVRPDLRLLGGFTYLDSKLTRTQGGRFDGKDVTGVPELTAVLSLEYDTAVFPGLTLTARAEHMGSQFIRTDNSLKVPAYQLYGLGARYQRTLGDKAFTLRLNINNLLGEDYWNTWAGSNNLLFPGAPRSINLSFMVDF